MALTLIAIAAVWLGPWERLGGDERGIDVHREDAVAVGLSSPWSPDHLLAAWQEWSSLLQMRGVSIRDIGQEPCGCERGGEVDGSADVAPMGGHSGRNPGTLDTSLANTLVPSTAQEGEKQLELQQQVGGMVGQSEQSRSVDLDAVHGIAAAAPGVSGCDTACGDAAFLAGYREAGGNPAWAEHFIRDVLDACESRSGGWGDYPAGEGAPHISRAQFHPDTWRRTEALAGRTLSPTSAFDTGVAVALWSNAIGADAVGTSAGWPGCWWVNWLPENK